MSSPGLLFPKPTLNREKYVSKPNIFPYLSEGAQASMLQKALTCKNIVPLRKTAQQDNVTSAIS